MTEIERIARKTRRHIYVSREFDGAAKELLPDYVQFSTWAERVLWRALLDEYGEASVLAAVEEVQDEMDDADLLREDDREQYELPA
ncbi:ORF 46 [Haloarcula hispanica virus SH1]|uniref:ORF 46 n=1 Tax=Haloarcula hispanica SH1 virus TaxID=326574 RepID=Q4KPE1_9VIRU|nr:ORF 46 [Haloarcula hispanica virus SH1]AAY24972.1 ORF 46 [Haloarcula hispanica virus SH1]